jgi:hypothetical protein
MSTTSANPKSIAYIVGSNKSVKNSSANQVQYQNYDFNQDIEHTAIHEKLKKPAILLFGDEQLINFDESSTLYKVSIKKDIRSWCWFEQRAFDSQLSMNKAIQRFIFEENINEFNSVAEIKTTPSAMNIHSALSIDSTVTVESSRDLQKSLILWLTGKTKEALPILSNYSNDKNQPSNNRAIAYNILAEHYSSRNQWRKVIDLCNLSITQQKNQKAAYILCSNAHKNLDDKEQAYNVSLNTPEVESTLLWFDINANYADIITFKMHAAEAFDQSTTSYLLSTKLHGHLSRQNKILSIDFIDRLIIQSIELDEIENAKKYLRSHLSHPDFLNDPMKNWGVIDKLLSFFLEKKAYDFAIEIYNYFIQNGIQASLSRRRMVALLIKTGQLNLARQLSTNSRAFFT